VIADNLTIHPALTVLIFIELVLNFYVVDVEFVLILLK